MEFNTIKERNEWVMRNKGLADAHVNTYLKYDPSLKRIEEDLRQAGVMGLIHGLEKFDTKRGNAKLTTIASGWARAAIQKCIAQNKGAFHVPYNKVKELSEMQEITEDLIESPEDLTDDKLDLQEVLTILTPLERKAIEYNYGLIKDIEPRVKPLINSLVYTAKRKLKNYFLQN